MRRGVRAARTVLAVAILLAAAATASAQPGPAQAEAGAETGELLELLARLRAPGGACNAGNAQAAPFAPNARLDDAAASMQGGAELAAALQAAGYRATRSQVITVGGALPTGRLSGLLAQNFCAQIGDVALREVGLWRSVNRLWIVLAAPFAPAVNLTREQIAEQMLALVNAARAQARECGGKPYPGVRPLRWNEVLERAALAHSRDMAAHDYFSHTARDGSTPAQRVARAGYRYRATGENIAAGQLTPAEAVAGWIRSPPHCANLMGAAYTEMGVAHAAEAQSRMGVYWTQLFGAPAPAK